MTAAVIAMPILANPSHANRMIVAHESPLQQFSHSR
jgi:hypothetical protein